MRPIILLVCCISLAGCAEHRLIVKRPNPTGAPQTADSKAFGWGAVQRRTVAECSTNLIDEVRVKQNLGQALVSVLTLGLYMPTRIEYVCANVPSPVGGTDN
jgi:Bor protein